jgi:toxin CcdB
MARYDYFANPDGSGYLLDVQADILDSLRTRVVIPLLPLEETPKPIWRLHPVFSLSGVNHVLATPLLAAVPVTLLAEPAGNLGTHHDRVVAALDMLFQGF